MSRSSDQQLPGQGLNDVTEDAKKNILFTLNRQNAKGLEKYGRNLETFNGRDSVREIWDEVGDTVNYLNALAQEYRYMKDLLEKLCIEFDEVERYICVTQPMVVTHFILEETYTHEKIDELIKGYK